MLYDRWPELRKTPAEAKTTLAEVLAAAEAARDAPFGTDEEIQAALQACVSWRRSAAQHLQSIFHPDIAADLDAAAWVNAVADVPSSISKLLVLRGLLLDDVLYLSTLSSWLEATEGAPLAVTPGEMIAHAKAPRSSILETTPSAPAAQSLPSNGIDRARRVTAAVAHVGFWLWALGWLQPSSLNAAIARVPAPTGLSPVTVLALIAFGWALYLTQLKIRWFFLLPLYIVFVPPAYVIWKVLSVILGPVFRTVQSALNPSHKVQQTRVWLTQPVVTKLWLVLWVIWLVAFRGINAAWVYWVPTLLTIPLWYQCMKWAFRMAVSPPSLIGKAVQACISYLDKTLRDWPSKAEKDRKSAANALGLGSMVGNYLVRRYDGEGRLTRLHRESLVVFSGILVAAFGTSCVWFALLAQALMRSFPNSLTAYNFFGSGSFFESVLWAFGCMTTAVGFPSAVAPLWVKAVHGFILAVGLFQVTYLIACFSIVSAPEAARVSEKADVLLVELRAKVAMAEAIRAAFERLSKTSAA